MRWVLAGGHQHDAPPAGALLEGMEAIWAIADRAYDSQRIIDLTRGMGRSLPSLRSRLESDFVRSTQIPTRPATSSSGASTA